MVASIDSIPSGSEVFIDANIFIYALQNKSLQCKGLLIRCAKDDVYGVTTFDVVAEITHWLMLLEAVSKGIITVGSAKRLGEKLNDITKLNEYWRQVESIFSMNIIILTTAEPDHRQAQIIRSTYGLLTNDSLIVAAMKDNGLALLASADSDFEHIPNLIRYTPTDI